MYRVVVLAFVCVLSVACSGSGGGPASASPVAAVSVAPSAAASPAVTPIPGCLPECVTPILTRPGDLPTGDYTTKYFFGGQLTVTVPAGWTSFEDSTGEFGLRPVGTEDRALLFWLDVYPIVDGTFKPVEGFDGTAKTLVEWIEANPNITVIEKTTGSFGGLEATVLDVGRSSKAVNVDKDCPAEIRPCVGLLSFPQWDGDFYGQGGPFHVRLVALDATWGGEPHGVYAVIDAMSEAVFAELAPAATEMIEGARLPEGVGQ
jgi:hypothetical protein